MRLILLPIVSLVLIAASPATDEALRLMDRSEEQGAFQLVERASRGGDADAIDYLARFYDEGRFVAADRPRAARQAAERGQRHAQWRLGVMLDLGEGVAEDPAEAFRWISRAAAQGSPAGNASMGTMYANGRGVARDYARSRHFYLQAARLGATAGFYGIALLHTLGPGVPENRQEGLAWMFVAATLGDGRAERAAAEYGLDLAATAQAASRATQILRDYGYANHRVRFRDIDADLAVSVT
jgi:TPR repeat protein